LEIAADDWVVEGAVEAILRAEATGHLGQIADCKVLVIQLDGYFASVMANEDRWLSQPEGEDPWWLGDKCEVDPRLPPGLVAGWELRKTLPHHVRLMDLVFQDASCFDIIHFHCDYLHFPLLRRNPSPSVTTLHGRLRVPDLQPLLAEFAEMPLVSISHDQRRPIP
jgi:hypothetical protein